MTNGRVQYITVEEPTSIEWVKALINCADAYSGLRLSSLHMPSEKCMLATC